jgi:subtilisin family serine protease
MADSRVRVAVIDSGWDSSVSEPRVAPGVGFVDSEGSWRAVVRPDTHDNIGHGTLCSDLILQQAPNSTIVPVRIFDTKLEASGAQLIRALEWALRHSVALVNISASSHNPDLRRPLARLCSIAAERGVIVVAAASTASGRGIPADLDGVVSAHVANSDRASMQVDGSWRIRARMPAEVYRGRGLAGKYTSAVGNSFRAAVLSGMIAAELSRAPSARPIHFAALVEFLSGALGGAERHAPLKCLP